MRPLPLFAPLALTLLACASAPKVTPVDAGEVHGQGQPIVLVHGFGDTRAVWRPVAERLARHFKVYSYDLLGFGGSANTLEVWTADAYAGQLQRFLEVNRIERPILVGHSMGAQIVLTWADRFRVDDDTRKHRDLAGVVLVDPSGGAGITPAFGEDLMELRGVCNVLGEPLDEAKARAAVERILAHVLSDPARRTPAMVEWYLAPLRTWAGRRAVMRVTAEFRADTMKLLDNNLVFWAMYAKPPEVPPPVLVLWGRDDAWFDVAGLEGYLKLAADHAWNQRFPAGFRTQVIESAGHSPHLEQPDTVAEAILEAFGHLARGYVPPPALPAP